MVEDDIAFETFDNQTISKNDLRDEIISEYLSAKYMGVSKVTDFTVGSEALHLADVIAGFLLEHRQDIDNNYLMSMIHTCVGEFLDNEGDMRGVHRIGASPSVGEVTFTRLSLGDTTKEIVIPEGTRVATNDAISFITEGTVKILSGAISVNASVICEFEGEYTNVDSEQILVVLGEMANEVWVTNKLRFKEGCDIEEDDVYRNRILEAPFNVPTGTLAWYENVCNNIRVVPTITTNNPMGELEEVPLVHDVTVTKGNSGASDVVICYNPTHKLDSSYVESQLEGHFTLPEYDVAGVTVSFHKATKYDVLKGTTNVKEYLFAVLTKAGYELDDLKDSITDKIIEFNDDAYIEIEFNPANLCILLEDIPGVASVRIIEHDIVNDSYKEIANPITIPPDHVYNIHYTNKSELKNRIQPLAFTIDLELKNEEDL